MSPLPPNPVCGRKMDPVGKAWLFKHQKRRQNTNHREKALCRNNENKTREWKCRRQHISGQWELVWELDKGDPLPAHVCLGVGLRALWRRPRLPEPTSTRVQHSYSACALEANALLVAALKMWLSCHFLLFAFNLILDLGPQDPFRVLFTKGAGEGPMLQPHCWPPSSQFPRREAPLCSVALDLEPRPVALPPASSCVRVTQLSVPCPAPGFCPERFLQSIWSPIFVILCFLSWEI